MAGTRRIYSPHKRQQWRRVSAERYKVRKALTDEYKTTRGCADCGWGPSDPNYHPSALDLDHLPGTNKEMNVSQMMTWSWRRILAEIEKCEVVCARCHRLRTMRRHETGEQPMLGRLRLEHRLPEHPRLFDV